MTRHVRAWIGLSSLGLALMGLFGCSLPPLEGRSQSQALSAHEVRETPLGRAIEPLAAQHPGTTGIHPLSNPRDAFAARVGLARMAQRTLDVQYYIWRKDTTGTLLLEEMRKAAERGVRVRLLLDDNGIGGLDNDLAALDAHPMAEVRIFNPFTFRPVKPLGYLTDFSRVNRRMHNKSFTADGAAAILGGRNVGDEYFGATDGVLFADLDVLAAGPAVPEVSGAFDRYWASGSAYPIASLVKPPSPEDLAAVKQDAAEVDASPQAAGYKNAVEALPLVQNLLQGRLSLIWAPTVFVADDPAKGLGQASHEQQLLDRMAQVVGEPTQSLNLVSPYFVPRNEGTDYFVSLAQRGVKVRILTNSMAATDVLAVHSGYAKARERLIAGGVQMYELKPNVGSDAPATTANAGAPAPKSSGGLMGSSGSSLHAKTFGVDGERVFVGSFNFDPRSARLNTELGFVIRSEQLAQQMDQVFTERVIPNSWQPVLTPDTHQLRWRDSAQQPPVLLESEPQTRAWQRGAVWLLEKLPIQWLL